MSNETIDRSRRGPAWWLAAIISDAQFWIPVIVLVGGLVLLKWIS